MKSRLKKVALMAPDMFEKQIEQISDKGRDVLKVIEDYKFFIEQVSRVVKNDPGMTQMIINKKKNLDQASQQIYDVVFDIENMDITTSYNNQQQATELSKGPSPGGSPSPNPGPPNGVPTPGGNPAPSPNPAPSNPPAAPKPAAPAPKEDDGDKEEEKPDKKEEKEEDKDKEKEDSSKNE